MRKQKKPVTADFSKTCAGCEYLVQEPWARGKTVLCAGAQQRVPHGDYLPLALCPGVVPEENEGGVESE